MNIYSFPILHGGGVNEPETIIVHAMAEFFQVDGKTIHATRFLDKIGLSAHAMCDKEGNIFECHPPRSIAYHAKGHNTNSLGIEFLVPIPEGKEVFGSYGEFLNEMKKDWTTEAMLAAGVEYIQNWIALYDIKHIKRHVDVDPDRKQDPGIGFPWHDFLDKLGVVDD